jgi:L,D-transpeptidase ErfK/SrfK
MSAAESPRAMADLNTKPGLGWLLTLIVLLAAPLQADQGEIAAASTDVRKTVGRNFVHTVASGESIFTIARKYNLAVDHLAFANGFPPTAVEIDPGVTLIIPKQRILPANPPRDGLVLNLPERGLYFFRNGNFDRFVPVSIGDENGFPTPTGQFHIIERIPNPTWYPPAWAKEKGPVGPGPDNPLGKHWIGLSLPRTGIHGTNQPLNVGNSVTHGCIRAYPEAVAQLFAEVKVGWPVRIEYETVKLGRDPEGRLKVVTFPDVYGKQNPLQAVRNRLGATVADRLTPLVKLNLGVTMEVERTRPLLAEIKGSGPVQAPTAP